MKNVTYTKSKHLLINKRYLQYTIEDFEDSFKIKFIGIPGETYHDRDMEITVTKDIINTPIIVDDYWMCYLIKVSAEYSVNGIFEITCKVAKLNKVWKAIGTTEEKIIPLLRIEKLKHKSFDIGFIKTDDIREIKK